jgi:hypothetical protein
LVGKSERKETTQKTGNNTAMDLQEIAWEYEDWIHLPQDRDQWRALVNTVMNLRGSIKGG